MPVGSHAILTRVMVCCDRIRLLPCLLVTAVLVLGRQPVAGQGPPTRSFTGQDGLAQSQITVLAQDSFGYLWVGTQGGASRYDGRRFTTFTTSNGLPDDVVTAIDPVADGSLLLGTDSGAVARWDGLTFQTVVARLAGRRQHITALHGLDSATVLVGSDQGLYLLTGDQAQQLLTRPVAALLHGWDQSIWVLSGSSQRSTATYGAAVKQPRLHRYSVADGLQDLPLIPGLAEVTASAVDDQSLWLAGGDGDLVRLREGSRQRFQGPADEEVQILLPVADGSLWIGSNRALWLLSADGELQARSVDPGLRTLSVSALLVDHEHSLWIGLWAKGLYQQVASTISLFTTDSGLPSPTVWSLAEDQEGCIWMGTDYGGVAIWCQDGWQRPITVAQGLPTDRVMCLLAATDGSVWIGTDYGLSRWRRDRPITTWTTAHGLPHSFIRGLAEDGQGRIWVATSGGLARWDGRRWRSWSSELGISDPLIRNLVIDHQGVLWLATHAAGVVRFDGERARSFTTAQGLPSDRVWCIAVDSRGWIWAGTDYGIWIHRQGKQPDRVLSVEQGLPSKNILFFVEDEDGYIWTGTNQGVTRIDPQRLQVKPVPAYESFMQVEANENAALRDSAGNLWLGMTEQVVRFDPRALPHNEVPPPVVIERLVVDGRPVLQNLPLTGALGDANLATVQLGPSVHELRFEYAALSFVASAGSRFRIMLQGYDPVISRPTDESHATYRNVPPGFYRFLVTACNNDGVWAEQPVVLPLHLRPRWYQTRLFQIGALLLAALAVMAWLRRRLAAEKRRQQRLEKQVRHRTAALQEANARIQEQNRLLEELSRTDPLTGLANRRVLAERLPTEMAVLRRELDRITPAELVTLHGITILMIDLDGFKGINDQWGHDIGDEVLRQVAVSIRENLREVDLAVRWGGDELVVLGRGVDRKGAEQLVRRLLQAVVEVSVTSHTRAAAAVSASIGFVTYPIGQEDFLAGTQWHLLVDAADRLMYLAKQRGRTRACGLVWQGKVTSGASENEMIHRITNDPTAPLPGLELVELSPGTGDGTG